uniref:Protein trichome birefringence-like 24 n=1 Tax=Elaeis guineensis var. tenera TaxID=51953 RepID=A0A6I9REC0_ELAGV|nr:protein trichome birefringence-like 24 [Elaeis guineensis]
MEKTDAPYTRLAEMVLHGRKGDSLKEQCDLFSGEWIPNSSGPPYTNSSCSVIYSAQDCLTNGRPDTGYLYWKWKPYGCDLSPFDAEKFLKIMRNKSWAFIGDSIFRNQVDSLLCLLSQFFWNIILEKEFAVINFYPSPLALLRPLNLLPKDDGDRPFGIKLGVW